MGRIRGHYEWDDDDLTPGQKSEGGLHQNLFDSEGNLRGSARFIPDADNDSDPLVVTETVYVPTEERRRTQEDDELQETIAVLIEAGIVFGVAKAAPHVSRWWQEKVRPGFAALSSNPNKRRGRRREKGPASISESNSPESPQELSGSMAADQLPMSKAEAQARYLAALAARAYSDTQTRLVNNAQIVEDSSLLELQSSVAELSSHQARNIVSTMATDPTLLNEDTLAELASILRRQNGSRGEGQPRLG